MPGRGAYIGATGERQATARMRDAAWSDRVPIANYDNFTKLNPV
jgi:hypothetical protein